MAASVPPMTIHQPGPDRREWGLIVLAVLMGLAIRAAFPQRMAVEHFDEGVYASNLWFDADQRFRYPARHLYAPPLLPGLLEWSQIVLGPTPWGTMSVGILSGTLTIGLMWWIVRAWFGVSAGLAAAALATLSDYHVIYSRTALTEPLLCLLLLSSVYFIWRAVEELSCRLALVAGLCTGLAWCVKYNGWLPLAIGVSSLSAWAIGPRSSASERGRRFLVLILIALVALLVFSPVWRGLAEDGGYRVVQENHARYLVGISGWGTAWKRQLDNHRFFDGPLSWFGLLLAVGFSRWGFWLEHRNGSKTSTIGIRNWLWPVCWAALLAVLGMWLGTSGILGVIGFAWLIAACPWRRKTPATDPTSNDLAYWLIAAWFIGLFLTTPLYTPYPRLSLPWLMAAWITAAAMIGSSTGQQLISGNRAWQSTRKGTAVMVLLGFASLLGITGKLLSDSPRSSATWQDRTGIERAAKQIRQQVLSRYAGQAVVYVYAEPALFFHLRAHQLEIVAPVADLRFAEQSSPLPILLAVGPHADRSPGFQAEFQKHAPLFELLESISYWPSDLVLLNHHPPERLNDADFPREHTIRIYRLKNP